MATVAILGGGVSGLSCAYYLSTLGRSQVKYIFLLEKAVKFGGWIQTTKFPDGAVFEHGPRTLRISGKPGFNALSLAEELHLNSHIIPITKHQPAAKNNCILFENKLHSLPKGVESAFKTVYPLSKATWRYALKDLMTRKGTLPDESVYDFGKRRFGQEVADYILDPMCRGVCAGNAREISVRSLLPSIYKAEQDYGSVIKGILKSVKSVLPSTELSSESLPRKAFKEFWQMWSLKGGLHQLIETLACAIEDSKIADIHVNAECSNILFKDGKCTLTVDGENIEADHIFSSIPAKELSPIIKQHPKLCDQLSSITSVNVAVVYLEYEEDLLKEKAFGFLVPTSEDAKVLGIVFDSCCFPQLNGKSKTRISCMMGGKWFQEVFGSIETVTTDNILKIAIDEVKRHLGIVQNPVRHQVALQKDCIPQYLVGHHKKLEILEEEIKNNKLCLSLIGASYNGAGVPDCIYNAKMKVEEYLQSEKLT